MRICQDRLTRNVWIMRHFLWEKFDGSKIHGRVAWDMDCRPKERGYLGIGRLVVKNFALSAKWLWRFPLEIEALWY